MSELSADQRGLMYLVENALREHQAAVRKAQEREVKLHTLIHRAMEIGVPAKTLAESLEMGLSTVYAIRTNVQVVRNALARGELVTDR